MLGISGAGLWMVGARQQRPIRRPDFYELLMSSKPSLVCSEQKVERLVEIPTHGRASGPERSGPTGHTRLEVCQSLEMCLRASHTSEANEVRTWLVDAKNPDLSPRAINEHKAALASLGFVLVSSARGCRVEIAPSHSPLIDDAVSDFVRDCDFKLTQVTDDGPCSLPAGRELVPSAPPLSILREAPPESRPIPPFHPLPFAPLLPEARGLGPWPRATFEVLRAGGFSGHLQHKDYLARWGAKRDAGRASQQHILIHQRRAAQRRGPMPDGDSLGLSRLYEPTLSWRQRARQLFAAKRKAKVYGPALPPAWHNRCRAVLGVEPPEEQALWEPNHLDPDDQHVALDDWIVIDGCVLNRAVLERVKRNLYNPMLRSAAGLETPNTTTVAALHYAHDAIDWVMSQTGGKLRPDGDPRLAGEAVAKYASVAINQSNMSRALAAAQVQVNPSFVADDKWGLMPSTAAKRVATVNARFGERRPFCDRFARWVRNLYLPPDQQLSMFRIPTSFRSMEPIQAMTLLGDMRSTACKRAAQARDPGLGFWRLRDAIVHHTAPVPSPGNFP